MSLTWNEITMDNQKHLDEVLKLYDSTFPINVRESHQTFLNGLKYGSNRKPNNFRFLIGLEGEDLVSFATGHYLADVNSGFIVYIVTNPKAQSKGVGTRTLEKLEELLNQDAVSAGNPSINTIVLETETEEMAHTDEEKENCIKRSKFFKKNNYKRNTRISYVQPPLHSEENDVPLNLLYKRHHQNQVIEEDINDVIKALYKEKYSLVNQIDGKILKRLLEKMGI